MLGGCAGILESGIYVDALNCTKAFLTYESHVVFALRFMIDAGIVGGNWVELPAGRYALVPDAHAQRLTHCQLEAHVHFSSLVSHEPEGAHCCYSPAVPCWLALLDGGAHCAGRGSAGPCMRHRVEPPSKVGYRHTCATPRTRCSRQAGLRAWQASGSAWRPSASSAWTSSALAARRGRPPLGVTPFSVVHHRHGQP